MHYDARSAEYQFTLLSYFTISQATEKGLFILDFTNPLNAELNSICHLLAFLGAHHILHVSRIRANCALV
jgi:hypothetical protein